MQIDPDKFEMMTDTNNRKPIKYNYSLRGQTFIQETSVKYLGVEIEEHVHGREGGGWEQKGYHDKWLQENAFVYRHLN